MTPSPGPLPATACASSRTDAARRAPVWPFVGAVTLAGAAVIAHAAFDVAEQPPSLWVLLLAALTIASGRVRIKVPGHDASVSVSEIFVFVSVLLFGSGAATLIVALDGLTISLTQKQRRLYRALFNIAEPALSVSIASHAFFAVLATPFAQSFSGPSIFIAPTVVMAAVYFAANSLLTATAVSLEGGQRVITVWRSHALYLAMNYYAAASIAVLVTKSDAGINVGIVGLVAPLLALSYAAYKSAASRVEDTDRHLKEVERLYHATVETLAIAVDAKDQVTHGHIRRVQRHTLAVARAMGVTDPQELRALEAASLLHDVGKLAVPDYVLNKPGALSKTEFERIKEHAAKGAEILTTVEFPYAVVPVVRHHHEQWNGKGYPDAIAGEDIPFGARILSVVDCFDAVTSDRPYRRKMTDEQGVAVLRERAGSMYDARIVEAFIALIPQLRAEDRAVEAAIIAAQGAPPGPATEATGSRPIPLEARTDAAVIDIADRVQRLLPGAEACFFVPGADGFLAVTSSTARVRSAASALRVPDGEGLAGWVAVNRHTIVNSFADLDLGTSARALGLTACTATPVFALGELVGVLSVYLAEARKFTDPEVRAVGAIAQEIGLQVAGRHFALDTAPVTTKSAA